jgi:hypothetical protein
VRLSYGVSLTSTHARAVPIYGQKFLATFDSSSASNPSFHITSMYSRNLNR